MLLGEYSVRTGKTPQQQKHIIHHRHTTLQQGSNPALAISHPDMQPFPGASHRPACQAGGSKRRRRGIGGGEVCVCVCICNSFCVYVCVCVISSCLYNWGGTQERHTAVLFPGLIFQQRPWPRPVLVRGSRKDKIAIV